MPRLRPLTPVVLFAFLAAILIATPAAAVRMITADTTPAVDFKQAVTLVDAGDYEGAVEILEQAAVAEPNSADVWNLLGFAYRNLERRNEAFTAYNKALLLNPDHFGANEYLGELYLQIGDPEKARAQLRILDQLCTWDPCVERDQLRAAIEAFETR
ncbi:MAG: tetratricopeptide repeat protein [Pseudomonadota bacterium]